MKKPVFDQRGFNHEVGLRVMVARKVKKLTQAKLGERIGITRCQLANMESGRSRWALDQVWRAAIILQIPISSLIPERQ